MEKMNENILITILISLSIPLPILQMLKNFNDKKEKTQGYQI